MSPPNPLEVEGELAFAVDSEPISRVRASDNRILLHLSSFRTARTLVACLPRRRGGAAGTDLTALLAHTGLELHATLRGRPVAHLSPSGSGSWLGRRLGLAGLQLSWRGLLLAAVAPRPLPM